MWEKIKSFFEKKVVKIVEGVIIAAASAGLIVGGVNAPETAETIAFSVGGVITAIEALISIIQGITTKKAETPTE